MLHDAGDENATSSLGKFRVLQRSDDWEAVGMSFDWDAYSYLLRNGSKTLSFIMILCKDQ